jgi:sterol desaturase/sphingolipid hydroxylase (fatty acid hydroxylase superfamily)
MQEIIDYFNTIPSLHRTLILVGGITFFWLIESAVPLFNYKIDKWRHASLNIFFTLTTILVNFILAFILVKTSDFIISKNYGILNIVKLPIFLFALVGLMMMDLISAYIAHYAEHKIKWLWVFHIVHHTDKYIDTTSANRHHPGESIIRFVFTTLAVAIVGAPMWLIMLYQSLSVLLSQFNHANIILPQWLNNILSLLLVTPQMHRVHHHYRQPYTDSNYGNIFCIWDKLFGTYKIANNSKLIYGVDTHMEEDNSSSFAKNLMLPFMPYKERLEYDSEEVL